MATFGYSFRPALEDLGTLDRPPQPPAPKPKPPDPEAVAVLQRAATQPIRTQPQTLGQPPRIEDDQRAFQRDLREDARRREAFGGALFDAPPRQLRGPTFEGARGREDAEMIAGLRRVEEAKRGVPPAEFGFVDIEDARRGLNEPIDRDEYIRANEFFKRLQQVTSAAADSPDIGAALVKAARTKIPYADVVREGVGEGARVAAGAPLPVDVGLEAVGLPSTREFRMDVAEFLAEALIPQEAWEGALELIPGIGFGPDAVRLAKSAFRAGAPEVVRAVRQVMESPQFRRVGARLTEETGSISPDTATLGLGRLLRAPEDLGGAAGELPKAVNPDMRDTDILAALARGERLDLSALPEARRARIEQQIRGSAGVARSPAPTAAATAAPPPSGPPLPVPPTPIASGPPSASLPEVFQSRRPMQTGLLSQAGEQIEIMPKGGRVTFPGGQPVVQGISESAAKQPPSVGGDDIVGRRLERDAQQRIETFEQRARALGAPEPVVRAVATAYRDGEQFASTARRYADSSPVVQRLAKLDAWIEGKVPDGVVNAIARARLVGENGVRLHVDEALEQFRNLDELIERAKPQAVFTGPPGMKALAEEHFAHAVVTHPDWWSFAKASDADELATKLSDLQTFQSDLYKIVQAIDPNAAPALDAPYLRSVWDIPESELTSAVSMPIGRASVTKKRAFPDPFEAMASRKWPYKLKQQPVAELVQQSAHLAARQIGTQLERKMILKRFGTTSRRPGVVAFRNPNYAGWYAKPEIVNFVDQLHEPGGSITRAVGAVTNPIRNFVFGVLDVGVFGTHVLNLLATRGPIALGAAINRSLERLGLGMDLYRMADQDMPRAIQRALDGLPQGQAGRIGDAGGRLLPAAVGGKTAAGRKINDAVEALNDLQFGMILTPLRNMAYEGNLLVAKLARKDVTDPFVRRQAAENAAAFSGASLGALRRARAEGERAFLGAPAITRSMAAELAQVAKLGTPEAYTTLATIAATVYGLGAAINMTFGSGEIPTLDPRSVDWATIHIGGEWKEVNGERRYVGGYRIGLIPQASLVRTLGKSLDAVQKGDPDQFRRAWQQFAFSRATPAVQSTVGLATGTGFRDGRFTMGGLRVKEAALGGLPVPIAAQAGLEGEIDSPLAAGLTVLGARSFPGDTEEEITEDQRAEARKRVEASGYAEIPDRAVRYVTKGRWENYDEMIADLNAAAEERGIRVQDTALYQQVQAAIARGRVRLREMDPELDALIVALEGALPRTEEAAQIVQEEHGVRVPVASR
jgi:hypothetical protein